MYSNLGSSQLALDQRVINSLGYYQSTYNSCWESIGSKDKITDTKIKLLTTHKLLKVTNL